MYLEKSSQTLSITSTKHGDLPLKSHHHNEVLTLARELKRLAPYLLCRATIECGHTLYVVLQHAVPENSSLHF